MVFSSDLVSARDCNMQRPAAKSKAASSFLNEIVLLQQHMLNENRSCTLCRRFHVLFENHVFGHVWTHVGTHSAGPLSVQCDSQRSKATSY